jgi:hypothetical protein
MDKKTETVSIRVTPEEKEQIVELAASEERKVSDTLHRLIFAGQHNQDLICIEEKQSKQKLA